MALLDRLIRQFDLENLAERVPVGHPVETERVDQQVHIQRLQPFAKQPQLSPAAQGLPQPFQDFAVHRLDGVGALDVLGVVDIFDADDAHEIHILVVVIEGKFHQPADRLTRLQGGEVHARFSVADITVELLQHLDV